MAKQALNQTPVISRDIITLYDRFTHGGMDRRAFMSGLARLAGSTAAATALLPLLKIITRRPKPLNRTIRALRRQKASPSQAARRG
jgi:hypothetical protein